MQQNNREWARRFQKARKSHLHYGAVQESFFRVTTRHAVKINILTIVSEKVILWKQGNHTRYEYTWVCPPFLRTYSVFEPAREIMALFVLRKHIIQTRMHSHPMGLDFWFLVGHFVYCHTSSVRTVKALARLRGWAGLPEPSLVAYVTSTIISWAGSLIFTTAGVYSTTKRY